MGSIAATATEDGVRAAIAALPQYRHPTRHASLARRIAVLIPCYNEAATVAGVVEGFAAVLPDAAIYVYDNASTDDTAETARAAGAIVRTEPRRGKGRVVRRMFRDVDADVYVLVDGDLTYDAEVAPSLIDKLRDEQLDLVTGERVEAPAAPGAYRLGHRWGNRVLTRSIRVLFGAGTRDMLSGYRVMSRRFVKSFPTASTGFEIETELTVHALEIEAPTAEVPTVYNERPEGSVSKLNTCRDGVRILTTIARLTTRERPMPVFAGAGATLIALAAVLAAPVGMTYFETGLVPRLPTLVAAFGIGLSGLLTMFAGAILGGIAEARREVRRLFYLAQG